MLHVAVAGIVFALYTALLMWISERTGEWRHARLILLIGMVMGVVALLPATQWFFATEPLN